jgi:hypothetical protein
MTSTYQISYFKKGKRYNFKTSFKSKEHMRIKLLQYEEGSTVFKVKEILNSITSEKFIPCKEDSQTFYFSKTIRRLQKVVTKKDELKIYIKR